MRRNSFFRLIFVTVGGTLAFGQTAADLFDDSIVHQVQLVVKPSDWQTLRDNYLLDTYYPADLHWTYKGQEIVVKNVAIRSHGHGSRNATKPSLLVDMNRNVSGQNFLGLTALVLKSNSQDTSLLKEKSVFKLWDRTGLPASRESYARLSINGEYWGVYLMIEFINNQFLTRTLGENKGDLYEWKPIGTGFHWEWVPTCPTLYDIACGTDPKRWTTIPFSPEANKSSFDLTSTIDMFRMATESTDATLDKNVSALLDLRLWLFHNAIEEYVADFDSILGDAFGMNNFWLYRYDKTTFQQFLPWDKDGSFNWRDRPITQNADKNVLMRRLLTLPDRSNQYFESLYRTTVLTGGPGGWLEWEYRNKYALIHQATLDDTKKQYLVAGIITPSNNSIFEAGVVSDEQFIAYRGPLVRQQAVAQGFKLAGSVKLADGGAVNSASNAAGSAVAPGSNVSLYGSGITDKTFTVTTAPLPTTLGGVTVYVNGFVAPLFFVSPTQINFQVPWELGLGGGTTPFTVTVDGPTIKGTRANSPVNATFSNTITAPVKTYAPGVYVVLQADGKLVSAEPAGDGDTLAIYCTGLGPVSGPMTTGALASLTTLSTTTQTPSVTIGGVAATVLFSGQTPGTAGVYQINVRLGSGTPPGGAPLLVTIGGETSVAYSLPTR